MTTLYPNPTEPDLDAMDEDYEKKRQAAPGPSRVPSPRKEAPLKVTLGDLLRSKKRAQ